MLLSFLLWSIMTTHISIVQGGKIYLGLALTVSLVYLPSSKDSLAYRKIHIFMLVKILTKNYAILLTEKRLI